MRRKITLGLLLCLIGGLSAVGLVAADSGTADPDLLNGSVTESVEPGGEIVVDGEFSSAGTSEVVVSAAENVSINRSSGTSSVISPGTEIFTQQDRILNGTSSTYGAPTDSITIDVSGDNITSETTGTLTQSKFNVTVSLRDAANSTLNATSVTVSDSGFFAGLPGLGDDSETGRNLLIGGVLLLVGYLYLRDE